MYGFYGHEIKALFEVFYRLPSASINSLRTNVFRVNRLKYIKSQAS